MNKIVSGRIKRRLLGLERKAEIKRTALMAQVQDKVFGAMKIGDDDWKLLDAIADRGETLQTCTPQEEAAVERFSAEFERAHELVMGLRQAAESKLPSFR